MSDEEEMLRQIQAEAGFVVREGYRVRRGKEQWADELYGACRRLGLRTDYRRRPHLRDLSERAGLKSRNTLQTQLQSAGYPEVGTLLLLEENVGVPVVRSLLALGVLTTARLEADLGISVPALPPADVPSPALAAITALAPQLPPQVLELLAQLFVAITAQSGPGPEDNSHGPSPTGKDR